MKLLFVCSRQLIKLFRIEALTLIKINGILKELKGYFKQKIRFKENSRTLSLKYDGLDIYINLHLCK